MSPLPPLSAAFATQASTVVRATTRGVDLESAVVGLSSAKAALQAGVGVTKTSDEMLEVLVSLLG